MPPAPPALPDSPALLRNLLDRAIVIGASHLEFLTSGEVIGTIEPWSGRLDANPQDGKFALYGAGIKSLAPDLTQFPFRYDGDHERRRGEYVIQVGSYEPDKILLEIRPKP